MDVDRPATDRWRNVGNLLIALGVAVWVVYAVARWGLGMEVTVSRFLPFHLAGVVPGALLRHRHFFRRLKLR